MLLLFSTITGCVSISALASLVCPPVSITGSAVGTKMQWNHCTCRAITAGIKKCNSIIKKKKKKYDKIALLEKDKLNTIEILLV